MSRAPWRIALSRLRRERLALASAALLAGVVAAALAAPLWAAHVARTTPERNRIADTIVVDGERRDVVSLDGTPIGPTWSGEYFLGADRNGRDVMVRLLYGARTSLIVGLAATLVTVAIATVLALLAGYRGGWVDAAISRALDVSWAFPVLLVGVALGVAFGRGGLDLGVVRIDGGSLLVPIGVVGIAYVTYLARPLRAEVVALRGREFVDAAIAQGVPPWRIMAGEILPNLAPTLLVLLPVIVAHAILLEAALSFLGAGVQPPTPSWGTMIADGLQTIVTAPHLTIAPGALLALTVLALNVVGDGVRRALDPRAVLRPAG